MVKRKATPRQLANLAKGREKLFQNQMKQRGINPSPRPQIIREVVRQPVINHSTTHNHNIKVQLSLFEKFLGTKFFPIEINKTKDNYNIKQLISHIFSNLNKHFNAISQNQSKICEIIDYVNYKEKENSEKLKQLKKENILLKKKITHLEINLLKENDLK